MKFVLIIVFGFFFVGLLSSAYADSNVKLTPFDISLSSQDFDRQGPLHQILILKPSEEATIPIKITSRDSVQQEIVFDITFPQNINSLIEKYSFEPQTIQIPPNSEKQVLLHLKARNNTDTPWGKIEFVAQSKIFGMAGKYFYIVIGDKNKIMELDPLIDHSLIGDLSSPAFANLSNNFPTNPSELLKSLDKIMPDGFVAPRYLPKGYSFQGQSTPPPYLGLVYAPAKIVNATESDSFWRSGSILIYSETDSPNSNLTKWMSTYAAQQEAKEIMINGLIGVVTEQQERITTEGTKYESPAEIFLFDHNTTIELRGNIPVDDLIMIAVSMHPFDKIPEKIIVLSPLTQFKSGISADKIQCMPELHLVIKLNNGNPACVKPETIQKLIERGWAKPV